jgi:hypothetical protein
MFTNVQVNSDPDGSVSKGYGSTDQDQKKILNSEFILLRLCELKHDVGMVTTNFIGHVVCLFGKDPPFAAPNISWICWRSRERMKKLAQNVYFRKTLFHILFFTFSAQKHSKHLYPLIYHNCWIIETWLVSTWTLTVKNFPLADLVRVQKLRKTSMLARTEHARISSLFRN